jgi:hypothetical protein
VGELEAVASQLRSQALLAGEQSSQLRAAAAELGQRASDASDAAAAAAAETAQVKCKTHTPPAIANRDRPDPYTPNTAWLGGIPRIAY